MTTTSVSHPHSKRPSQVPTPRHAPSRAPEPEKQASLPVTDDTAEFSRNAPLAKPEDAETQKNFITAFVDRVTRFFKDLSKAFNRLLGHQEPKTDLDKQLKSLKHNVKHTMVDTMQQHIKNRATELESSSLTSEERQLLEPLFSIAKSDTELKKLAEDSMAHGLEGINQTLANPEIHRILKNPAVLDAFMEERFNDLRTKLGVIDEDTESGSPSGSNSPKSPKGPARFISSEEDCNEVDEKLEPTAKAQKEAGRNWLLRKLFPAKTEK